MTAPGKTLAKRLVKPPAGWLDIETDLDHFALINYAVPAGRLRPHIDDRFDIPTFPIAGQELAMLSVVPFVDSRFHFRALPFVRFHFCQTNYRVYVQDRATGEHAVWFFGTTLGSPVVHLSRWLWKIPWYRGRYRVDCNYDADLGRYQSFRYDVTSDWAPASIDIEDSGQPVAEVDGFPSRDAWLLILTNPVDGYFYRSDNRLGTYSVHHDLLDLTVGRLRDARFGLLERLDVVSPEEARSPHSVFLCRSTRFHIYMPPRVLRSSPLPG